MGDSTVLCFSIGARESVLSLGGPGHQVVDEEDAEAGGGATCVGAARPVNVRVGGELVDGSDAQVKTGGEGALEVPENTLDQREVGLAGSYMNKHTC